MKIVFFGTPEFAVPFLKTLFNDKEIEILAVVTQNDKKSGRKQTVTPPPVKIKSLELYLPVFQPETLKNNTLFYELLKNLKPDFFVVIAYGKIFPKEYLDIPKYGAINVHASLLPKYRGASPIQSALLHGDKETGLSFIKIDEKLDCGDIFLLKKEIIEESDNYLTLSQKLSNVGSFILPTILKDIKNKVLTPIPQDESKASFCEKITKKNALIDAQNETAENILNKFKAYYLWPGIFMNFNNKRLRLIDLEMNKNNIQADIKPGELKAVKKNLYLGTKDGLLLINELQPEGKNVLKAVEFINGFLQ
jgi:methionyl-tRNA formyltransferase